MRAGPILDAFTKTKWAEVQTEYLSQRIRAFFSSDPYEIVSQLDGLRDERVWKFKLVKQLPGEFAVDAGAILHSLRSPLDQILGAVVAQNGLSESGVGFPFGRSADHFEAELQKQKKLPDAANELIREAQPYSGGNNLLWGLHELNRRDKHRAGLVPLMMPSHTTMSFLKFTKGLGLVVGCKTGKHLLLAKERPSEAEIDLLPSPKAHYECDAGSHIQFGAAESLGDDSLEFLTTTPSAVFETDFKPALDIGFREKIFNGKPMTEVLHAMRQSVERILLSFEKRYF